MKKLFFISICLILTTPVNLFSQKSHVIKSGFYLKFGPSLPWNGFANSQTVVDPAPDYTEAYFPAAKFGGAMDLGYLIYFGPPVANGVLRFGMDAGFLSASFNTSDLDSIPPGKEKSEFWYYFIGQKFGPLISINPVDRLIIDLSWKLNAYAAWHNSDWGSNLTNQEVMMNIRYRVILFSVAYNFGKVNFNDFDKNRPAHQIDNSTLKILIGLKF